MLFTNTTRNILILIALAYIFLMLGNGILSLTNPDEVFYTQTAKEMVREKNMLVPHLFGRPQFEKPILTYWIIRLSFFVFGISPFGARFFPALFGVIGVVAAYLFAQVAFKDKKKAFLCAAILMSSAFYIGMSRTVFTDMFFSVFITLSHLSFFWGYTDRRRKGAGIILFFAFSAFAVLTKGPLGFTIVLMTVLAFLWSRKELKFFFCRYSLAGFILFLIIAFPWYIFMIKEYGKVFIDEFFVNDHLRRVVEAEHPGNDKWYFYPLSMVLLMAPWSLYLVASLFKFFGVFRKKEAPPVYFFLCFWILSVFVTFQIAHSKLTSYILPLFPALALITGDFVYDQAMKKTRFLKFSLMAMCFLFLAFPVALAVAANKYPEYIYSRVFLYRFIFIHLVILLAMFFFIRRRRFLISLMFVTVQVPALLFFVLSQHRGFEDYVSSKNAAKYLMENYKVSSPILCSKILVRGVRFYTDKDVVVTRVTVMGGANFFSPHPIPNIDAYDKLRNFLKAQEVTYGIITKSSLKDITEAVGESDFEVKLLKIFGNQYVVRVVKM